MVDKLNGPTNTNYIRQVNLKNVASLTAYNANASPFGEGYNTGPPGVSFELTEKPGYKELVNKFATVQVPKYPKNGFAQLVIDDKYYMPDSSFTEQLMCER